MDLPSGRRILINDMKPAGSSYGNEIPSPTAFVRNVERDVGVNWDNMEMNNVISPQGTIIVKQPNEKVYHMDDTEYM